MSAELIASAAEERYFYPRQRFHELAEDHVPYDELLGATGFEARACVSASTARASSA